MVPVFGGPVFGFTLKSGKRRVTVLTTFECWKKWKKNKAQSRKEDSKKKDHATITDWAPRKRRWKFVKNCIFVQKKCKYRHTGFKQKKSFVTMSWNHFWD